MDKRKTIIGLFVALLLCVAVAWGLGLFGGDPAVAKLQDLGRQMDDKNLPEADRNAMRDQFRQQMQSLTDDQRRAFFDANRGQWEARSQQRMNEFFAMSKADQQKHLDEILNRMNKPNAGQQPRGNGNANGGGPGTNGGGGNRGGAQTEAQREERAKRRLDSTSPKTRAQFAEFRKMLDKRAQERGMPIGNGGGPWRGRS